MKFNNSRIYFGIIFSILVLGASSAAWPAGGCYSSQSNCLCPLVPAPMTGVVGARMVSLTLGADVNFDFDRAALKPAGRAALDGFVQDANQLPGPVHVDIEGHTDSIGSAAYNQGLSERRAASVKNYLVTKGIPNGVITAAGYGETRPVADNATAGGRAQNRRVEVTAGGGFQR